jgi:hypothetical protein
MSGPGVPVSDEAAIAAAEVLIAYHQQCLATAVLDVIAEHHQGSIAQLEAEIRLIPHRTAARRRREEEAEGDD